MKLKTFISEALKQLIEGVKESQQYAAEAGAAVNPSGLDYLKDSSAKVQHKETTRIGQEVEFDLEIATTEATEKGGHAEISVVSIGGLGGKVGSSVESRSASRIKFKVPVIFPKMIYKEDPMD